MVNWETCWCQAKHQETFATQQGKGANPMDIKVVYWTCLPSIWKVLLRKVKVIHFCKSPLCNSSLQKEKKEIVFKDSAWLTQTGVKWIYLREKRNDLELKELQSFIIDDYLENNGCWWKIFSCNWLMMTWRKTQWLKTFCLFFRLFRWFAEDSPIFSPPQRTLKRKHTPYWENDICHVLCCLLTKVVCQSCWKSKAPANWKTKTMFSHWTFDLKKKTV